MALKFHDIFAGERVRSRKRQHESGINDAAICGHGMYASGHPRLGKITDNRSAIFLAAGPDSRTTPIPAWPGAVAIAAMVSTPTRAPES